MARSTARTPSYSSTSSGDWSAPDLEDFGYDSVEDMSSSEKTDVAETSLLGEARADTWDELVVLPVVDENGTLYKSALQNAKARANQVSGISSDAVQSAKNKATQLMEDEYDVETEKQSIEEFVSSLYKGVSPADVSNADWGEYTGLDKRELASLVGNTYDVTTGEALEMLDTMPEISKELRKMKLEELKETVEKVRDGELEVSEALDKFVDVDSDTIEQLKEELDKEEPEKEEKEKEKEDGGEDKNVEEKIDEKAEKLAEEEDIEQSKAMEKVLEDNPDLYEEYKHRGA